MNGPLIDPLGQGALPLAKQPRQASARALGRAATGICPGRFAEVLSQQPKFEPYFAADRTVSVQVPFRAVGEVMVQAYVPASFTSA